MLSAVFAAVLVYALFLCVHWIPFRLMTIHRRTRTMTVTLLLCLPALFPLYTFFSNLIPAETDFGPMAGAVLYGATFFLLWCGYVQFVFSFDTSPSLRVLVVLDREGALTAAELIQRMNFRDTFKRRFFRAVDGGAILSSNGRFCLPPLSIRLARIGRAAKNLFRLGAGG